MRRRSAAAVSAAAMAAAAALAGTASAQDEAANSTQAGSSEPAGSSACTPGKATTPGTTTTTPATTTTTETTPGQDAAADKKSCPPDKTTDLGELNVELSSPPKKRKPAKQHATSDEQRRAGARKFLKEEKRAKAKQQAREKLDVAASPFAGLPSPLLAPPATGVPNVLIDSFRIPPFLLPIYQAAGVEYGIRWEVLAAINEIETDYGRNLSVSTAGALGWMQFMPGTWATYGVDANRDGRRDPYNPVDAIFAAARYLKAAGAGEDLQRAIFAYNHAQWYVDDVLKRARTLSALPTDVVGALTGLTMGRFPVTGKASYAGAYDAKRERASGNDASVAISSKAGRRSIDIVARRGASAVAVQDGRVVKLGTTKRLGRFVKIRDVYGNTYTYGHLGSVSALHAVPKRTKASDDTAPATTAKADPRPTAPATAGKQGRAATTRASRRTASSGTATSTAARPAPVKERLFANPQRPRAFHAGGERQLTSTPPEQPAPRLLAADALGRYLVPPYNLRR